MKNIKQFTLTAMFLAILLLLAFTPLGFIPIGPINATTMHIPVIIASIILGPKIGGFLGVTFGIISLIRSTIFPTPLSFVFSPFIPVIGTDQGSYKAIFIALIPRILIGILPYFIYKLLNNWLKKQSISLFCAGLAGSLINTILVMNMIYFFFAESYGQVIGKGSSAIYSAILATILGTGIPEAIVAAIATTAVCTVLLRLMKKNATQKL